MSDRCDICGGDFFGRGGASWTIWFHDAHGDELGGAVVCSIVCGRRALSLTGRGEDPMESSHRGLDKAATLCYFVNTEHPEVSEMRGTRFHEAPPIPGGASR